MDGEQKKFGAPEIVLMLILAAANDATTIVADLSLAMPAVGIAIAGLNEVFSAVVWGIMLLWFILKLGVFGGSALIQAVGGLGDFFGIPSRMLSAGLGIWLANHPKLAAVAEVAAGRVGAIGEVAAVEEAAEVTAAGERAVAAEEAARRGEGVARIEGVGAEGFEAGAEVGERAAERGVRAVREEAPAPGVGEEAGEEIGAEEEAAGAPPKKKPTEEELGLEEEPSEVKEMKELMRKFEEVQPEEKKEEEEEGPYEADANKLNLKPEKYPKAA